MALPPVEGWLIDFRTARAIFVSASNERINHCVGLCQQGRLHICHCEEHQFKEVPILSAPFLDEQNCISEPDDDVFGRCATVSANPLDKQPLAGNDAAIFLTATALSKNFGVISNHRSPVFATVYDLCMIYGVPIFSADGYFDAL